MLGSRSHGLQASSKCTEIPAGFMSLSAIPLAFHTHTRRVCSGMLSTLKSTFSKLEYRCRPETRSSTFACAGTYACFLYISSGVNSAYEIEALQRLS